MILWFSVYMKDWYADLCYNGNLIGPVKVKLSSLSVRGYNLVAPVKWKESDPIALKDYLLWSIFSRRQSGCRRNPGWERLQDFSLGLAMLCDHKKIYIYTCACFLLFFHLKNTVKIMLEKYCRSLSTKALEINSHICISFL